MRDGGRLSAAIEVLTEIEARHRPAKLALKAWGDASRFAGSKDRAFVSGLVLDALRKRRSLGWMMGADTPRAVALGALRFGWSWPVERIADAAGEEPHGPGALSDDERGALEKPKSLDEAPPAVRGDYPDWLDQNLERVFGDARADEAAALSARAPVDLRVNLIKSDPERAAKVLQPLKAEHVELLPQAFRIAAPDPAERAGAVETIPAFGKGWFEVHERRERACAPCTSARRWRRTRCGGSKARWTSFSSMRPAPAPAPGAVTPTPSGG